MPTHCCLVENLYFFCFCFIAMLTKKCRLFFKVGKKFTLIIFWVISYFTFVFSEIIITHFIDVQIFIITYSEIYHYAGKGTIDAMFTLRMLMEKYKKVKRVTLCIHGPRESLRQVSTRRAVVLY